MPLPPGRAALKLSTCLALVMSQPRGCNHITWTDTLALDIRYQWLWDHSVDMFDYWRPSEVAYSPKGSCLLRGHSLISQGAGGGTAEIIWEAIQTELIFLCAFPLSSLLSYK